MILVESSTVKSIDYLDKNLIIEYKNGAKYQYEDVPKDLFENMKTTESVGKFVNAHIKGQYKFKRLV